MNRYDELKEVPDENVFVGSKYADVCCSAHGGKVIDGFPDCPECGFLLLRNFTEDSWVCGNCATMWDTPSLIEALEINNWEATDGI